MPTMAPTSTPQNPAQEITTSAGSTPSGVSTPVTRQSACSIPVTGVDPAGGG